MKLNPSPFIKFHNIHTTSSQDIGKYTSKERRHSTLTIHDQTIITINDIHAWHSYVTMTPHTMHSAIKQHKKKDNM